MKFGIVVSEWNPEVTNALRDGAVRTLRECGCSDENIIVRYVPGTFELPMGARFFAEHTDVDGVIALGCVVKGETPEISGIDNIKTIACVEACYASIREKRTVTLDEILKR